MSQAPIVIADAAGAVVRAAINSALEALTTCQSGAVAPSPTYPNMFWYDTANNQLKRRNNANDAWIVMIDGVLDTDGTLSLNSDDRVSSQKAVKTYVDGKATDAGITLTDVTTNNASTSKHGFLKKLSNVATEFMNGVGNWVALTIDSLLPSQTGNSGKFLTTNGVNASWGAIPDTGALKLISTTNVSGGSSTGEISITNSKSYKIVISGKHTSGDVKNVRFSLSPSINFRGHKITSSATTSTQSQFLDTPTIDMITSGYLNNMSVVIYLIYDSSANMHTIKWHAVWDIGGTTYMATGCGTHATAGGQTTTAFTISFVNSGMGARVSLYEIVQ